MDVMGTGLSFNAGAEGDAHISNTNIHREHAGVRSVSNATQCPFKSANKGGRHDHVPAIDAKIFEGERAPNMEREIGIANLSRRMLDQGGFSRIGNIDLPLLNHLERK